MAGIVGSCIDRCATSLCLSLIHILLCPFTVLGVIRAVMGLLFAACGFVSWPSQLQSLADWSSGIIISVLGLMALAALTIIVERDQIGATNKELLAYVLSFPIYILSYVPISFQAIFAKAQWKPCLLYTSRCV